jgi:raffinose/stachyose/melibiose transport system substrate-binding protein
MQDDKKPFYPPNDAPPTMGSNAPVQAIPPAPSIQVPEVSVSETSLQSEPSVIEPAVIVDSSPLPPPIQPVEPMPLPQIEDTAPVVPIASVSAPVTTVEPVSLPPQPFQPVPIQTPPPNPALASVLTPSPLSSVISSPPLVSTPAVPPVPAKKGFLKIIIFAVVGVLLLAIIGFILFRLVGSSGTSGGNGELTWWGTELDEETVESLIKEYESAHSGIKVTYVKQSPLEYRERLTNALASGRGPDIFEIHNTWPAMFKSDLAVMPASVMGPEEYKASFYPVVSTDMTTAKGIVGIPLSYDAITLYINEDIFSSALKTAPRTWIEVQELADSSRGMTQKDEAGRIIQSAVALGTTDNVDYWPDILGLMMYQNKASFTNLSSTTTRDVLTFYQFFNRTAGAWDSTLPNSTVAFARQKTAMIFAPGRAAVDIIKEDPTLHFKTVPLPQLPKENPSDPDFSYATYWAQAVWERGGNKSAAWEFLKFMSSQETLQKINQDLRANSKTQRAYPRPGMNQELAADPILGSIIALAPSAKSWYLADKTNDGATGINTQLKNAYTKALLEDPSVAQTEIAKILTQYGITIPK